MNAWQRFLIYAKTKKSVLINVAIAVTSAILVAAFIMLAVVGSSAVKRADEFQNTIGSLNDKIEELENGSSGLGDKISGLEEELAKSGKAIDDLEKALSAAIKDLEDQIKAINPEINPVRLDAPTGLTIENGVLSWTAAEGASTYYISIDGEYNGGEFTATVAGTTYTIPTDLEYGIRSLSVVSKPLTDYELPSGAASVKYAVLNSVTGISANAGGTVSWNAVLAADAYDVTVNDRNFRINDGTSFDLNDFAYADKYTVTVRARAVDTADFYTAEAATEWSDEIASIAIDAATFALTDIDAGNKAAPYSVEVSGNITAIYGSGFSKQFEATDEVEAVLDTTDGSVTATYKGFNATGKPTVANLTIITSAAELNDVLKDGGATANQVYIIAAPSAAQSYSASVGSAPKASYAVDAVYVSVPVVIYGNGATITLTNVISGQAYAIFKAEASLYDLTFNAPEKYAAVKFSTITNPIEAIEAAYLSNVTINGGRHALVVNGAKVVIEGGALNPSVGGGLYVGMGADVSVTDTSIGAGEWGGVLLSVGIAYGSTPDYSKPSTVSLDAATYNALKGLISDEDVTGDVGNGVEVGGEKLNAMTFVYDEYSAVRFLTKRPIEFGGGLIKWYADRLYDDEYNFNTDLSGDVTVYAKIVAEEDLFKAAVLAFYETIDDDYNAQNDNNLEFIKYSTNYDKLSLSQKIARLVITEDGIELSDSFKAEILGVARDAWKAIIVEETSSQAFKDTYFIDETSPFAAALALIYDIIDGKAGVIGGEFTEIEVGEGESKSKVLQFTAGTIDPNGAIITDGGKIRAIANWLLSTLVNKTALVAGAKAGLEAALLDYYRQFDDEKNDENKENLEVIGFDKTWTNVGKFNVEWYNRLEAAETYVDYQDVLGEWLEAGENGYVLIGAKKTAVLDTIKASWKAFIAEYIKENKLETIYFTDEGSPFAEALAEIERIIDGVNDSDNIKDGEKIRDKALELLGGLKTIEELLEEAKEIFEAAVLTYYDEIDDDGNDENYGNLDFVGFDYEWKDGNAFNVKWFEAVAAATTYADYLDALADGVYLTVDGDGSYVISGDLEKELFAISVTNWVYYVDAAIEAMKEDPLENDIFVYNDEADIEAAYDEVIDFIRNKAKNGKEAREFAEKKLAELRAKSVENGLKEFDYVNRHYTAAQYRSEIVMPVLQAAYDSANALERIAILLDMGSALLSSDTQTLFDTAQKYS